MYIYIYIYIYPKLPGRKYIKYLISALHHQWKNINEFVSLYYPDGVSEPKTIICKSNTR